MKRNVLKRMVSIVLIAGLCLAAITTAFAAEKTDGSGYTLWHRSNDTTKNVSGELVTTNYAQGSTLGWYYSTQSSTNDSMGYFSFQQTPLFKSPSNYKGVSALSLPDTERYRLFPVSKKGDGTITGAGTMKDKGIILSGSKLTMKVKKGGSYNDLILNKGYHFMLGLAQLTASNYTTYDYTGSTNRGTAHMHTIQWVDVTEQINKAGGVTPLGDDYYTKISVDIDELLESGTIKNVHCPSGSELTKLDPDKISAVVFGVTGVDTTINNGSNILQFQDISIEYLPKVEFTENSTDGVTMAVDTSRVTTLTVITAYYKGEELADVSVNNIAAAQATTDLTISSAKEYDTVKFIAIDNLTNITPLAKALEITK